MDKKTQALIEQYAKSLVEVAVENDCLADMQSDIEALLSVFEETGLNQVLANLGISHDEKIKLVRLLQESRSAYLNNFLEVILQNERETVLYHILLSAQNAIAQVSNQYDVYITSVVALTDEQKRRIKTLVTEKFGVKVGRLIENIDESILGGFIVSVNNKVIDTSLRRQLQEAKMNLK